MRSRPGRRDRRGGIQGRGDMPKSDLFLRNTDIELVAEELRAGVDPARPNLAVDLAQADLRLGGGGGAGTVTLQAAQGGALVRISADTQAQDPPARIMLDGGRGAASLGGGGTDAVLHLRDRQGRARIALGAGTSRREDETTVAIDGVLGAVTLGGQGTDGDVYVRNGAGEVTVHVSGGADPLTRPLPNAAILIDGHSGTLRCRKLLVLADGVVTDLLARIVALEAEIAALKRGR
jgi:hypothetical protein